jgi:hypothetical protein
MGPLSGYGVGSLTLILLVFYFVRKIPAYIALCNAIVVAFWAATLRLSAPSQLSQRIVLTLALLLCAFGLLIVRIMLIRSVSLRLLAAIDSGAQETIGDDIGGRMEDMRAFHLVRATSGGKSALTRFGWFISGVVAVFYWIFRLET